MGATGPYHTGIVQSVCGAHWVQHAAGHVVIDLHRQLQGVREEVSLSSTAANGVCFVLSFVVVVTLSIFGVGGWVEFFCLFVCCCVVFWSLSLRMWLKRSCSRRGYSCCADGGCLMEREKRMMGVATV